MQEDQYHISSHLNRCDKDKRDHVEKKVEITQQIGKERGNPYWKNEEISRQAYTRPHKSLIETFWHHRCLFNKMWVIVCEHTVKMVPRVTYIYSLLFEKDICDRRNNWINLLCFFCFEICLFSCKNWVWEFSKHIAVSQEAMQLYETTFLLELRVQFKCAQQVVQRRITQVSAEF